MVGHIKIPEAQAKIPCQISKVKNNHFRKKGLNLQNEHIATATDSESWLERMRQKRAHLTQSPCNNLGPDKKHYKHYAVTLHLFHYVIHSLKHFNTHTRARARTPLVIAIKHQSHPVITGSCWGQRNSIGGFLLQGKQSDWDSSAFSFQDKS